MIRRLPAASFVPAWCCIAWLAGGFVTRLPAQAAAPPPVPVLTPEQKKAAAAVEVPQALTPPPLPGQLQSSPATAAPAPAAAPPAASQDNSASKMQALEALTQPPAVQPAPRATGKEVPITSSTSTSGQFIVHGPVFQTRSAMSTRCEEISQELRKVLNDKDPWVLPIVVLLNTGEAATKSQGPAVATAITEITNGGFHLQVTVNERPGLNAADLRKEIVRALLAERVLRHHASITMPEGRLLLPDWVMTGVLEAMDYKASPRPSTMFATIFRSGKIYGIEEIIEASPVEMDGLSRTIYETSCCALVLALSDQPEGSKHFNQFLNSLASDPRSERELLNLAFPSFTASASSLNKWWSLQLAALSKPGIAEPLTAAESLNAIADAITISYQALPEEVPKDIKQRPFVLPAPLAVAGSSPPPPAPQPKTTSSPDKETEAKKVAEAPPSKEGEEPAASGDEEPEKPKRSLLRRLLFLSDAKAEEAGEELAQDTSKIEEMPTTTAAEESDGGSGMPVTDENKPSFLSRLFGGSVEKKDETKKTEDEKAVAAAIEKPKTEAPTPPQESVKEEPSKEKTREAEKPKEAEAGTKEDKKPSKLNPLNWFRGGKKDAEEQPAKEEAPSKEKQASTPAPSAPAVARLISPVLADAWAWLAPAAPRPTAEPILNFLRRKPKKEDEPKEEPEKKSEPKAEPKSGPKPSEKPSSRPRTTNPNAKPASKPTTAPAAGAPRTTNPNSRPLPAGVMLSAAATAPGPPATLKNGKVPVLMPIEEYRHILKHPDRVQILQFNIASLRALELRVSVLFRPVVGGYLAAITDIQQGKTKDMDKRLADLRQFALIAYQKSVAVRDYLDWFEASETDRFSNKFDDYLNLPKIIQEELPRRTDPISKYLDAIDQEFTK